MLSLLVAEKSLYFYSPRDRSFPAQPIIIRKAQSRKKAHVPLRTSWIFLPIILKMSLPCSIMIQSCYFDFKIDKPFTCSCCVICVPCSLFIWSRHVLRAQRIMGVFILITHKSTKSENLVTWQSLVTPSSLTCASLKSVCSCDEARFWTWIIFILFNLIF